MSQPGVFVIGQRAERLFEWALQPGDANMAGAKSRVQPQDVLAIVKDKLAGRAPALAEARVDEQDSTLAAIMEMRQKMKQQRPRGKL